MPTSILSRRALFAGALFAPSRFHAAAAIIDKAIASGQLHAAVLRVDEKGDTFERAFGKAKPESAFLIASITKPMTASAVMLLADRGLLKIEDPASKYLP